MTRIFVISDSHYHRAEEIQLSRAERADIAESDLIIHCGDIVTRGIYEYLAALKPIKAVLGNMDGKDLAALSTLPHKDILEIEGLKIGVIHGWGWPHGLAQKVVREFPGVQAVCFGHSHVAYHQEIEGVFAFNPGSFSHGLKDSGSYGLLEVSNGKITGKIIKRK